jgi:Cof subfamily protein (haloacid dehalogenase superfamily)
MIRAAFFDVDGTLLSHKTKQVPPSARSALQKLKAAGIPCIVATGRQISEMEKLPIADIAFDGYLTLNGQLMLDGNKEIVFSKPITGAVKDFLVQQFETHTYPALLVEEKYTYLNFVTDHVRATQEAISSQIPPLDTYKGGQIYQVCAYLRPEEERHLAPIAGDCVITRWHFGGMDVVAKGGGKVSGIQDYLSAAGISRDEIIAFGDGENDIGMLSFAGIGVAMGNAVEGAKAAADYVTADIDDDGIEKALKHFGLIE